PLRRLLQQNSVAERRYTYQRQTIGKGFILRQRDVFMLQLAAGSAALSDARVELEPVPDGGGDEVFLKLKVLLDPCGLTRYPTDYWGAYTRHLDADKPQPGKRNT